MTKRDRTEWVWGTSGLRRRSMRGVRAAAWVGALTLSCAFAGCSGTVPAASAPSGPAQSTPTDTATTPDGEAGGAAGEDAAAGCPDTVFSVYAQLEGLAETAPGPIAQALGITLPSEPLCTITYTDNDGDPGFTMFWKGDDYVDTYNALVAAITAAGFQYAIAPGSSSATFTRGEIAELAAVARDPATNSRISQAIGGAAAVMWGPDVRS